VEMGAVVMVPEGQDLTTVHEAHFDAPAAFEDLQPHYSSRMPILGNDVLQSWMDRVRKLGVQSLWLASGPRNGDGTVARSELVRLARQGVERLLVIKLKSYAEMDLADLLRFHCQKRNPVTEACDARGQLGVSLLDRLALRAIGEQQELACAATDQKQRPYKFNGYAKRILSASERQELVGDVLTGACAMRPLGTEIREHVWVGKDASLADSVRLVGPAYIGARTIIRSGATIGPFVSVEHDCVVDCGTTVERSTVLPYSYLAPGLLIRHGLVDGGYLENLNWGTVVDMQPAGLGRRIQRHKARKPASKETPGDGFSRADVFPWQFAPSSSATQPWLQVRL
jgi:carbonic anhydrase/acetyltransferase-like protein (isoleucine patch superfamily)